MSACALDDPVIYKAWPEAVVMQELRVFKDAMYNDAGPDELAAGLLAIDFLVRGSTLSDTADMLVGAAVDEANMRIALMLAKEDLDRTEDERRKLLVAVLGRLANGLGSVHRIIESAKGRFETAEELNEWLDKYRPREQARSGEGA